MAFLLEGVLGRVPENLMAQALLKVVQSASTVAKMDNSCPKRPNFVPGEPVAGGFSKLGKTTK